MMTSLHVLISAQLRSHIMALVGTHFGVNKHGAIEGGRAMKSSYCPKPLNMGLHAAKCHFKYMLFSSIFLSAKLLEE